MPKPNASIVLNSRDATGGRPQNGNLYNQLLFNAENQNIIQGQIQSVAVSEVNFPYDIPNVQYNVTDEFFLTDPDTAAGILVKLNPGFYTGTELENNLNLAIAAEAAIVGVPANDVPLVTFDPTENLFSINPPLAPTAPIAWYLNSPYSFPDPNYAGIPSPNKLGKDLPSMMGFLRSQGRPVTGSPGTSALYIVSVGYPGPSVIPPDVVEGDVLAGGSAPLTFTQYIDICSPQLCKFQFFRDGSTTNLARRSDVICRLYIANNVATQEEEGTRPFVISRQYKNARVMRWTADNAVGTIDINLYDDVGQPLTTTWAPRPYQITFNCYEDDKKEAGGGGGGGGGESIMEKFANYVARNEAAWASPSYPLSSRR